VLHAAIKTLSSIVWPEPISLFDKLNRNAEVSKLLRSQKRVFPTFYDLYDYIQSDVIGNEPFDYLEFGVFEGNSIREWAVRNKHPASRLIGFDSFEGLPEAWTKASPKGHFGTNGKLPIVNDDRISFVKGWFQKSLPPFLKTFEPRSRLVVFNDSDLYSSTLFCLTKLDHLCIPGSVVILDDFGDLLHQSRAWRDYISAYCRKTEMIGMSKDASRIAFVFL
jgi:hypothetical protein